MGGGRARAVIGDVEGRRPILVDDMISTAGTIAAAAEALGTAGSSGPIVAAATHGLLVGPATEGRPLDGLAAHG